MTDEQDDLGLGRLYRPSDPKPDGLEEVVARGGRRRRRWAAGGLAAVVIVVAVAVVAAWPGSNGPEQVRVGDGAAVTTTTVATQPGSGTTATTQVGSAIPAIPQAPTTTTPGSPTCDAATVSAGLVADLGANAANELVTFGCSGNFAYAEVTVPPPASAAAGTPGIGETLLLTASGTAWVAAPQSTYCPGGSVPAAIYKFACGSN